MDPLKPTTILAGTPPDGEAVHRDELERLYARAVAGLPSGGVRVAAAAGSGASEMLRQLYDRLFRDQRFCVPFYFAVRPGDSSGESAAARYLYQFLLQYLAFQRREPELLASAPDICELTDLAAPGDAEWIGRLTEIHGSNGPFHGGRAFMRSALAAPFRAGGRTMRVFPIIDDLHEINSIDNGGFFIDELTAVFEHSRGPYIFAARRNFTFGRSPAEILRVETLDRDETAKLIDRVSGESGVTVAEQVRDLIAIQFGGRPPLIRMLIGSAREKSLQLASYRDIGRLYADELLTGRIGEHFERRMERAAPDPVLRRRLIETLHSALGPDTAAFSLASLRERLKIDAAEFTRLIGHLETDEIVNVEAGLVSVADDHVLRDFIETRQRAFLGRSTPASVAAFTVTATLKRAPQLMARAYRGDAAADLQNLLLGFDLQSVPRSLLDYRTFRDRYKGVADETVRGQVLGETDTIELPQISHSAPVSDHYPAFADLIEPERAAAGIGFRDRAYRDEDQVAWFAVEIDSKLEAGRRVTEEWTERIDQAAAAAGISNYRIWLVAPEGFADDALDLLDAREGIGSSRRQVELLRSFLSGESNDIEHHAEEYEMVIPIGDETELIAAHSLEEIARRHNFPAKALNQIKTALVEACINAAEHSLSPDRKVYQKFIVDDEKIVITISNRGLRLVADNTRPVEAEGGGQLPGRRGWGLSLIRNLMDDVKVEQVDDGTRISMTKYLKAA